MLDYMVRKTLEAVRIYGDEAFQAFVAKLRERRFESTYCEACQAFNFPPKPFCEKCFSREVVWRPLPARGTLYAFSQQDRGVRFTKPDVLGLVELEGVGRILTRIDASFESLRVGQEVEADFVEIHPDLVLHQFRPVPAQED